MGHIDKATGRNKRESARILKPGAGKIGREAGKKVERRVDQKRRGKTERSAIVAENGRREARDKRWARARSQAEQRGNRQWN